MFCGRTRTAAWAVAGDAERPAYGETVWVVRRVTLRQA